MVENQTSPPKSTAVKKDWTKGPILNNLLLLSWPMVVMETLYTVSQVVDMIWVGKLGSSAVAGVGIANIVLSMVMTIDLGFIAGARAMIARFIGSGDVNGANRVAGQAFILCAIWGAFISLTGAFLAEPIMSLFGAQPEVVAQGTAYIRILFAGWITMEFLVMGLYVIQASGDAQTPMKIELLIRIVHVTLCPFLVLGIWIFPQMGTSGAALSNIISQIIGSVLLSFVLFKGRSRLHLALKDFRPAPDIAWRILKIGIPASVMSLQRSLGNLILTWFMVPFGTLAVAAHSLTTRVEMFLYMPSLGLATGGGVLVGQNLGARQPERAERSAWLATGLVEVFMLACSAAIILAAENIMGIFSDDRALIELGGVFLRIAAAGYLVMAFTTVLQSCLAGAGDTLPNMIISMGMIWLIQLPMAFLLPRFTELGVYGVRWAMVAGTFSGTIAYIAYFRMGKWKVKKV